MTSFRVRACQVLGGFLILSLLVPPAVHAGVAGDDPAQPQGSPERVPVEPASLELSIGGGVVFGPRPYEGASAAIIAIPVVNVRYKRLFAEGIRGGVQVLKSGRLTGNAYLQANFEGLESTDSASLAGMNNRSMSADAGAELVYRARPIGFRFNVLSDVLGRNSGQEISLQALTGAPLGRGSFLLAGIGPRWVSATRVDYYYGVSGSEARPGRPEYRGTSSWNWDLSVGANIRIAGNWSLFALFSREAFGSPIENSPVVSGSAAYSMITSLTYRLR